MRYPLIISGSGGQGVMSAGIFLAAAAAEGGCHATFLPVYGPAQRGGAAKCTVVISDAQIYSPLPKKCAGLIAMNEASCKKYLPELAVDGVLIRNSNRSTAALRRTDINVIDIPSDDIAAEIGAPKASNIVLLGALIGYDGIIGEELVSNALVKKFAGKGQETVDKNKAALHRGIELGKAAAQKKEDN